MSAAELAILDSYVVASRHGLRGALESSWDDGNAKGLDGWVGPGRGTEPDDEAIRDRERYVEKTLETFRAKEESYDSADANQNRLVVRTEAEDDALRDQYLATGRARGNAEVIAAVRDTDNVPGHTVGVPGSGYDVSVVVTHSDLERALRPFESPGR